MPIFILRPDDAAERWRAAWTFAMSILQFGKTVKVELSDVSKAWARTLEQNDALNAACQDVSKQVQLEVDGRLVWADENDWRHVFVAAYRRSQRVARFDGSYVILGASSRDLSVSECSDVIDIVHAFGNEHGVKWSDDKRRSAA